MQTSGRAGSFMLGICGSTIHSRPMDRSLRTRFNAIFTDALHREYARNLGDRIGAPIGFRLAETPLFLPADLGARLVAAAEEIMDQLVDSALVEAMAPAIPERWLTPGIDRAPSFAQVDFAIVRQEDGSLAPRLIELQGFPSIAAFTILQRDAWSELLTRYGLGSDWASWFTPGRDELIELVRRTIVGENDPREVVILEIEPESQKTLCDFAATKKLFGVDCIDIRSVVRRGRLLLRPDPEAPSRLIPIRRIHNRVVFDELIRSEIELPFDYRRELDVEWAPHPNWYWIWSKATLPHLRHESLPEITLLNELDEVPDDLDHYVLKPLFTFAGSGVNLDPTPDDVREIPAEERSAWCLQKKIEYEPALVAVDGGGVKAEVRMMFFRPDDAPRPILGMNLVRLSRGRMLGVDHNSDFTWVGSSVGMWRG